MKEGDEHGGHGAFGIGASASPDFAVAFFGGEGFDGHAVDGDGVEMGAKKNAGAVVRSRGASDEVGAVGEDFFEGDVKAPFGQEGREVCSHLGFAGVGGTRNSIGIDGGNADEILEKGGDGHD